MRTSDYIKRAILKYENEGGETRASSEASGVTSAKVQVRDANGNLLAEYDKADFPEQTTNTPKKGLRLLGAAFGGIAVIAFIGVYAPKLSKIHPDLWFQYILNPQSIYNPPSTPSTTENGMPASVGASQETDLNSQQVVRVNVAGLRSICGGYSLEGFQEKYLSQGWRVISSSNVETFISTGSSDGVPRGINCITTNYVISR